MLANVLLKTIRDQGRLLVAWAVSLVFIVAMYAAVWPSVKSQPSISGFIEQMPEAFRSLFATSSADMSTPTGYIQVEPAVLHGPDCGADLCRQRRRGSHWRGRGPAHHGPAAV
ncbi:hypothetical protein NG819_16755 [Pseudarthrobacter sp. Fe7]|nr:hypothetical protein NG819_16755 [Pseudarthrobacter sp. Fe7]